MAGLLDLTGQNIENTYQRVLQTDGTFIYDGTGSLFTISGNIDTGSFATTGSNTFIGNQIVTGSLTATSFTGSLLGTATTASVATILQTARTIGGVSFNGSANINLPGVNTTGNQNTSGYAASIVVSPSSSAADVAAHGLTKFYPLFTTVRIDGNIGSNSTLYVNSGSFQYIMGTNTLTVTSSFAVSASRAVSSSFATTASFTPDAIVTASVSSNTITFTKGNSTTFAITVNTGSGAGGATSPGGSTTQIQYNNAGAFGGVPNLTWNGTTLNATGSFSGSFAGVYTPITVTAIDTISSNYTITKPGTYIVQSADPTFTYAMGLPDPRAQPIGSEIKIINMDGANNLTLGNSSPYDLAGNAIGALAPQSSLKLVCFNIDGTTATNKWYSI